MLKGFSFNSIKKIINQLQRPLMFSQLGNKGNVIVVTNNIMRNLHIPIQTLSKINTSQFSNLSSFLEALLVKLLDMQYSMIDYLSMKKGMLMTGINLRSRCDWCQVMTRNLRSMTLVSKFRLWWPRTGLSVGDDANSW